MSEYQELWAEALSFQDFVAQSTEHKGLWEGLYRIARLPEWASVGLERMERRLLVIAEDWCGDASNTSPILAKWAEQVEGLDLRVIRREEYPEVMDRFLTNGSRSIPIVLALDAEGTLLGHWGPRPEELQEFVMTHKDSVPKAELYPQVRRWYARNRGETTLCEVAAIAGIPLPAPAGC